MELIADTLTKRFGPYTALDGVSLRVSEGDSIAVHGPNGSGKTTLLRILAGLSTPTEGTVTIDDVNIYDRGNRGAHSLGYLSHDSMMYDDLTARENLRFHARLLDVEESRVDAVLDMVDLTNRADGFPREFSHGMKKRLSFARSLLDDPQMFLLDEPFTGLDQHSTATLERMIEDKTVVLATHEPSLSTELCDRFLILENGRRKADFSDGSLSSEAFRDRYEDVLAV
jgi:heme exporter protein A